jgi:hypothetical protein
MIARLENLGTRLLHRLVPSVIASAAYCRCEPGSAWCCPERGYLALCECVPDNGTCFIRSYKSLYCL